MKNQLILFQIEYFKYLVLILFFIKFVNFLGNPTVFCVIPIEEINALSQMPLESTSHEILAKEGMLTSSSPRVFDQEERDRWAAYCLLGEKVCVGVIQGGFATLALVPVIKKYRFFAKVPTRTIYAGAMAFSFKALLLSSPHFSKQEQLKLKREQDVADAENFNVPAFPNFINKIDKFPEHTTLGQQPIKQLYSSVKREVEMYNEGQLRGRDAFAFEQQGTAIDEGSVGCISNAAKLLEVPLTPLSSHAIIPENANASRPLNSGVEPFVDVAIESISAFIK